MSRFPSKFTLPIGTNRRSKFDLSNDVVTTTDFYRPKIFLAKEVVPGDKWSINTEVFTRLTPLLVPTFGRMDVTNRFFFVPYRTIFHDWYEFINNEFLPNGYAPNLHHWTNEAIVNLFCDSPFAQDLSETTILPGFYLTEFYPYPDLPEDFVYDFNVVYGTDQSDDKYYRLTHEGKVLYDILLSLGYSINWSVDDDRDMSAMPFVCFAKLVFDFYEPTTFASQFNVLLDKWFKSSFTTTDLSADFLASLINCIPFNPDYFTSAWTNPTRSNDFSNGNSITILDPTLTSSATSQHKEPSISNKPLTNIDPEGTAYVSGTTNSGAPSSTGISFLTSFALKALDALQSYMVRNNLTGYRPIDRLFARYGVKLDYKQTNRALYLGSTSAPISISDVMAQSDTYNGSSGAVLGDYAGKGLGYVNDKSIDFTADEFGLIFGISTITPRTSVGYLGTERHMFHLDPLSFFTPEFEKLGVQAIRNDELFSSCPDHENYQKYTDSRYLGLQPDGIFGWTARYAEYKTASDRLTGDFRVPTLNSETMDAYHLMRDVGDTVDTNASDLFLNRNFLFTQSNQFDRIFNDNGEVSNADHFMQIFHNEVHVTRNMESISDTFVNEDELEHYRQTAVKVNGSFDS